VARAGLLLLVVVLFAAAPTVQGSFALETTAQRTRGFFSASSIAGDTLARRIDIHLTDARGITLRRYDVDMTKRLHLIVVSDDFKTFMHVHPALQGDGHFILEQHFPRTGLYHMYADCMPTGFPHQVFRYDLSIGTNGPYRGRDTQPSGTTVDADRYRVSINSTSLRAREETELTLSVTENGMPARNLHSYLGALAHVVILNARDLSYAHVHAAPLQAGAPMRGMSSMRGMSGMSDMKAAALLDRSPVPPTMVLHVLLREPGAYRAWVQFRGGASLHVASFVIDARPAGAK
jgi:hypothetical protein